MDRHRVAKSPRELPSQLRGESDDAYERFLSWLVPESGKRSLNRVALALGLNAKTISEQAVRYAWHARAVEYDRRVASVVAAKQAELARDAVVSQYSLASTLIDQCAELVQKASEVDGAEWCELALAATKILERVQKIQRLALGLSTDNVSLHVTEAKPAVDLSLLSDSELELLAAGETVRAKAERELNAAELAEVARVVSQWQRGAAA